MTQEDYNHHEYEHHDHHEHHEHMPESSRGHRTKMRFSTPIKIAIGIIGGIASLALTGLSLFVIAQIAGPASEITQSITGIWQGVLNTLQPFADLYNQTIGLISGVSGEQ